jgi:holo-[acyl-carrier protein] synthase
MVYGIGVDIINIGMMKTVIDRWGTRFINRVFTAREIDFCFQRTKSVPSFALRFAAKEAFSKAIGFGMRKGIRWRDIEIFHHPSGRPDLRLTGRALSFCNNERIGWHLTLSDEEDYGIAVVVLEKMLPETKSKDLTGSKD